MHHEKHWVNYWGSTFNTTAAFFPLAFYSSKKFKEIEHKFEYHDDWSIGNLVFKMKLLCGIIFSLCSWQAEDQSRVQQAQRCYRERRNNQGAVNWLDWFFISDGTSDIL